MLVCTCLYTWVHFCLCMHVQRPEVNFGCLPLWFSTFVIETGSLPKLGPFCFEVDWLVNPGDDPVSTPLHSHQSWDHKCAPSCLPSVWTLGIQAQIPVLAWQVLSPMSRLSSPLVFFICLVNVLRMYACSKYVCMFICVWVHM